MGYGPRLEDHLTLGATTGPNWRTDKGIIAGGGFPSDADGTQLTPFVPVAAQQTLAAGGGAVDVTSYLTIGASDAGGDAWTLADGTVVGQLKKIILGTDGGGDAVLTPTNLAGGTTITFNDANDYVVLVWDGGEWNVIENVGATVA